MKNHVHSQLSINKLEQLHGFSLDTNEKKAPLFDVDVANIGACFLINQGGLGVTIRVGPGPRGSSGWGRLSAGWVAVRASRGSSRLLARR